MALSAQTALFISQLGQIVSFIENTPEGAKAYKLVPASFYHEGQEFPYEVREELSAGGFRKVTQEGLDYYLVPELSASNANGKLSHYASQTAGIYNQPVTEQPAISQAAATESPEVVKRYIAAAEQEAAPKTKSTRRKVKKIQE